MGAFPGQTTQAPSQGLPATGKNATSTTSADSQLIKIQISYTDTMGERRTVEKQLTLSPANLNSASTTTGTFTGARTSTSFWTKYKWFIIGVAAIVVIGGGYVTIKKRKSLKALAKAKK
jgi:hypothetical protein